MTTAADAGAGPWQPLLSTSTPWDALDEIILAQCRRSLEELHAQLQVSTCWDEHELARALKLAEPVIRARWTAVIHEAWWHLQRAAGREH